MFNDGGAMRLLCFFVVFDKKQGRFIKTKVIFSLPKL